MTTQISPVARPGAGAPASARFDRRKKEILTAAAVLINRNGLGDTTLVTVAAEFGLNFKSLRYYFERREDLLAATYAHSIALHRDLVAAAARHDRAEARIRCLIQDYFALIARVFAGDQPEHVYFSDLRALGEPHSATIFDQYTQLFRDVRALFGPVGEPWPREARNAKAHLLISQLFWSVAWLGTYVPEDFPRVADRFADILLGGIALAPVDLGWGVEPEPDPAPDGERLSQESFLRAATHLINEMGYRGASVDRISAMLNVSKGAFYHHNETRDTLVMASFQRTFDVIRKAQGAVMATDLNGAARVGAAMVGLVTRQMRDEGTMLRTTALTAAGPELRVDMTRRLNLLTLRFADMLNDGLADGAVRICDVRIAAEMVTATINSAAELRRWVPGVSESDVAELYVRPLLDGLLTRPNA